MSELPDLTGGGDPLVVRDGDRIVPASQADQAVVRGYPIFDGKGPAIDGYRLTILASAVVCAPGEPVRVFHICESVSSERPLYVMGPKPVAGEYVDDRLATEPADAESSLAPAAYDGRVLDGPGIDTNYDVTEYRWDEAGQHTIQWRPGAYESNLLIINVVPR